MNLNQVKYYTKEDALAAVRKNGNAIESVSTQLKDDYEIVKTAILNGGTLYSASHRLRNDASLVALDLKRQLAIYFDPHCCDFVETVFAAKNDKELLNLCRELYADWEEFNLEMKLFYGDDYDCPISEYNELSKEALGEALASCRKHLIESCLEVYKKTRKGPYSHESIKRNKKLSQTIRHRTLRWGITSWEKVEKAATYIVDMLEAENNRIKKWISETAEKTGGSYPERFMNAVLKSMNIEFYREQVFPWSKGKRYDFYIPSLNAIIEVHGAQHYEGGFEYFGGQDLKYEQKNDKVKEKLAQSNGILNYIIVNAMRSTFEYIKNSVCTNKDFLHLFDIKKLHWNAVKTAMEENEKPLNLPLYQEKMAYNDTLMCLFKETLKTVRQSANAPKITKTMQFFSSCAASQNGLFPHEILLLGRVESFEVGKIPDYVATKWRDHFQESIVDRINILIDKGFTEIADTSKRLGDVSVPVLKKALIDNGLDASGRKEDIIRRLKENLNVQQINDAILTKFYALTDKGKAELVDPNFISYKINSKFGIKY